MSQIAMEIQALLGVTCTKAGHFVPCSYQRLGLTLFTFLWAFLEALHLTIVQMNVLICGKKHLKLPINIGWHEGLKLTSHLMNPGILMRSEIWNIFCKCCYFFLPVGSVCSELIKKDFAEPLWFPPALTAYRFGPTFGSLLSVSPTYNLFL